MKTFQVRLDDKLLEALEVRSQQTGMTHSAIARDALRRALTSANALESGFYEGFIAGVQNAVESVVRPLEEVLEHAKARHQVAIKAEQEPAVETDDIWAAAAPVPGSVLELEDEEEIVEETDPGAGLEASEDEVDEEEDAKLLAYTHVEDLQAEAE